MILYITYSSVEMQLLFRNYEKPRHAVIGGEDAEGLKHVRLIVAYMRGYLVQSLPMYNAISFLPGIAPIVPAGLFAAVAHRQSLFFGRLSLRSGPY